MSRPVDPDPNEAQRRAADGGASVWVAASAGTGKTKVLTDRVLNLMLRGSPPGRILCLTFTKAAAAEMRNRIADRLGKWAICGDGDLALEIVAVTGEMPEEAQLRHARRLFARILETPGGMKILTIHSFCQSLLRRFPLEAGVPPHFEVMDDRTAGETLAEAREAVLARARGGADSGLAAALAEVTRHVPEAGFGELLSGLTLERARLRRACAPPDGHDGYRRRLHERLGVAAGATVESLLAEACAEAAFDGTALRAAAEALLGSPNKKDQQCGERLAAWLAAPETRADGFDDYLRAFHTADGEPRKDTPTKKFGQSSPHHLPALGAECERLLRVVAARSACALLHASCALVRLGDALLAEYERQKDLHARLDYDDLILKSCDLLQRPGVAPWVLFKLDGGLDHVLIDEAQDTNPEQWQVVAALADEFFAGSGARGDTGRTIFAVGDAKQSIYSFQRADPEAFLRMREHFRGRVEAARERAEQRWDAVDLAVSFRSTDAVLSAVDAVFARPEASDGVALDGGPIRHAAFRRHHAGRVELWPPVEPVDAEPPAPWEPPVRQRQEQQPRARLAQVLAATVRHWLRSGERLEARGREIAAGDVMVLVRRRGPFVGELVRALKQQDVPVAGIDRMLLTDQLPVQDLMALGNFLLLPEDDLTLATVLKGPLFHFSEEMLFELCHARPGALWQELRGRALAGDERFRPAAEELARLLGRADFVPPYELYAEVLGARRGRHAILDRLGPEALDPVDEFLSMALAYERTHIPSLQGFLHWLETGEAEVKRDLGQRGRDEVRILTVHGSKGLQAPVVILPDTLQAPTNRPTVLWTEDGLPLWCPRKGIDAPPAETARQLAKRKRDEEYRRLLYVAMTRAEDRLYVCGWKTKRPAAGGSASWYELIAAGLAGLDGIERDTIDFTAVAGELGWSGPALRVVGRQATPPKFDFIDADPRGAHEAPAWLRLPPPAEPAPPKPLAPSQPEAEPAARSPIEPGEERSARFRRGLLVHKLLQSLPALPPERRAAAARLFLARPVHRLEEAEQAEIATETLAVLEHPEFAPLFAEGSQAEVPVVGLVDGYALSGQIDRLVVTPDEVLIVDYKTLRPPPTTESEVPPTYLRQLAAYAEALTRVYPGRPVRAALLWTDGPRLMPISPALLAGWAP